MAAVVVAVALAGCGGDDVDVSVPESDARVEITYYVEGTASGADLTFTTPDGDISQATGKAIPLDNPDTPGTGVSSEFRSGTFASISAQNTGDDGTVICRIEADGVEIASNQSTGAYVIASCDATVP